MKFKKLHISFFILFFSVLMQGQDLHFTQFHSMPVYLNPALTGAGVCSRASLIYRNQWPGINKTYQTYMMSYDHFLTKENLGVGFLCGQDIAGTGGLKTTLFSASLAYELKINKSSGLRLGFQPGIISRSVQFDKLFFGDQISRGGGYQGGLNTPTLETPTRSKTFFDIGAGTLYYYKNYWVGASFSHLNKPNQSLMDAEDANLPIKYSVHGGTKFVIEKDKKKPENESAIYLVGNYRGQKEFDQFDVGVYFSKSIVSLGLWYRGIPGLKAYKKGYNNNDAIAVILGLQKDRFRFGYSYDITISLLALNTRGAHELTMSYQFCKTRAKSPRRLVVSCPKF